MLSKGIKITAEIELGSYDLLLEFARANLGVACVIKEFSKEYLEKGIVYKVKLKEEIPKRSIGLCFLKSVSKNRIYPERLTHKIEHYFTGYFVLTKNDYLLLLFQFFLHPLILNELHP